MGTQTNNFGIMYLNILLLFHGSIKSNAMSSKCNYNIVIAYFRTRSDKLLFQEGNQKVFDVYTLA